MAADIDDLITRTFNSTNPNVAKVTSDRPNTSDSLTCDNLTGWPEETAVHFATYKLNAEDEVEEGSQIDWKGIANTDTNTITAIKRLSGASDAGNQINDIVEMMPTASWADELARAILTTLTTKGEIRADVKDTLSKAILKDSKLTGAPEFPEKSVKALNLDFETFTYSSTEHVIGSWIDEKPLYRKVVNLGTLPATTAGKNVPHGVEGLLSLVTIKGFARNTDGSVRVPLPHAHSATNSSIALYADNTNITVLPGFNASTLSGYAIIEYTKS